MIRLRHLRLRSITGSTPFGADLSFRAGLNVIYAGNTSGKSTCLQSVIFALGLERSLGPQLDVPLPYAMRERIHRHRDDDYTAVLESYVELELENASGEVLVVRRDIAGGKDSKLIQTWDAPRLSDPSAAGRQRDFYVHDGGAAQREDGFHTYLARFIGWELPQVPRFDGAEGPLYLETIFPMVFVEQKRGWSSIQGPFPTFFRIQDVSRRVMEFLLDLEAGRIRRERAEIRRQLTALQQQWALRRTTLEEQARHLVKFRGIPPAPTAEFAHASDVSLEVIQDGEWLPLATVLEDSSGQLKNLEQQDTPTADAAAKEIERRLAQARTRVDELTAMLETVRGEFGAQLQEHRAIEHRVDALETDLKRNQDAQKLKKLGSDLGHVSGEQTCPTCHQWISSELLPTVSSVGMALDENIAFVRSQLELYRATLASSADRLDDYRARYHGVQDELNTRQQEVRGLRQALIQPSSAPSRAIIEEIVRIQAFVDRLRSIQERTDGLTDELRSIAAEWASYQDRLRRLSGEDLTAVDIEKVDDFEATDRRHLSRYGFRSFQPNEIKLSRENFRPMALTTEGGQTIEKEINFELSASDVIRLKWAYYLSMLSVSKRRPTNHCGLVIFDEPGQQEIEAGSLHSFLEWSAKSLTSTQQVLVATSEPLESLRQVLQGTSANLISFDGFILQPIS